MDDRLEQRAATEDVADASDADANVVTRAIPRAVADPGVALGDSAWDEAVAAVRASVELRESILRSVMSSMAIEGFDVDREQSDRLLDEALSGPPLMFPGDEWGRRDKIIGPLTCHALQKLVRED